MLLTPSLVVERTRRRNLPAPRAGGGGGLRLCPWSLGPQTRSSAGAARTRGALG